MLRVDHGPGRKKGFPLPGNALSFADWRYVHPGSFSWRDAAGVAAPLWNIAEAAEASWQPRNFPFGLRLVAQAAQKSEPVSLGADPWERNGWRGMPRFEDGRYQLWYECVPPADVAGEPGGSGRPPGEANLLCYAESDDGVTWKKPTLTLHPYADHERTNIVYGGRLCPDSGYHGGGVFRDPSADPAERYKVVHLGMLSKETLERYLAERPEDVDASAFRGPGRVHGLFGAVSPDGIHWAALPEPLVIQLSDTGNVAEYDPARQEYVAYIRMWQYGRRVIGRTATKDFRRWPLPDAVLAPDASVRPSVQWYGNAKTTYPGQPDLHLMFPLEWRVAEDLFYTHLATSVDNRCWSLLPGGPVLSPGPDGAWDGGGVSAQSGMVPLPGNRVGVLFSGFRVPHKYPRSIPVSQSAWAWWPAGRLVALAAEERGEFATQPLLFEGSTLRLNVRTKRAGHVLVEVVGASGEPLPGRSFAEATPITGDHAAATVSWNGETAIGHEPDSPVTFRFRLYATDLFGLSLE